MESTVTVGSGRSIHWGSDCGSICGANFRNGFFTKPKSVKADAVTCKRCTKIMAAEVAKAEVEAYEVNEDMAQTEDEVTVETISALAGRTVLVYERGGKLTGQWLRDENGRTKFLVQFPHPVGPRWHFADEMIPA